ncbi:MAG: hypothetical protein KAI66_22375 [Lentisphaeria bacterium]|nr:hypothetical protein [Lentisphaeria bacterium]
MGRRMKKACLVRKRHFCMMDGVAACGVLAVLLSGWISLTGALETRRLQVERRYCALTILDNAVVRIAAMAEDADSARIEAALRHAFSQSELANQQGMAARVSRRQSGIALEIVDGRGRKLATVALGEGGP